MALAFAEIREDTRRSRARAQTSAVAVSRRVSAAGDARPDAQPGGTPDRDPSLDRLSDLLAAAGPLRRIAVAVAGRIVAKRGWERLGFARVGDYARERLGLSGRTVLEWARVERSLSFLPQLEDALIAGALPWSKVRMLARFATPDDEAHWIRFADAQSVRSLERAIRAVDREALPNAHAPPTDSTTIPPRTDAAAASGLDEDGLSREPRERIRLRVSTAVAFAWADTCRVAARVAGERIPRDVALEMVTAETLSALPSGWSVPPPTREPESVRRSSRLPSDAAHPPSEKTAAPDPLIPPAATSRVPTDPAPPHEDTTPIQPPLASPRRTPIPAFLEPLLDGLETADAFTLDTRLRRIVRIAQRLDAEVAPLLRRASARDASVTRATKDLAEVARGRLGLSPRKARALARLDRFGDDCPTLRHAFRTGELSWVQAQVLAPLLVAGGPDAGIWGTDWVEFAGRVTVRRLEDAVEQALTSGERDPARADAMLDERIPPAAPPLPADPLAPARSSAPTAPRTIERALSSIASASSRPLPVPTAGEPGSPAGWQTCARRRDPEDAVHISIHAPRDVARLFRATLASVRKRLEAERERLPSESEGFIAMLEHARATWEAEDPALRRYRRRYRVFERDGWQCAIPGCRSHRNLQAHHIVFRSAGGGDELTNQTTLCAFHHHRGVHAARVAVRGRAPDRLRFELGLRTQQPALIRYRSGDRVA